MRTLTVEGIPDTVYRRLKAQAEEHRRSAESFHGPHYRPMASLNSEVIVCLEQSLSAPRLDTGDFLKSARKLRGRLKSIHLTEHDLNAAKRAGRP